MEIIQLAINEPFAAPPADANWVMFIDSHPFVSEEDAPRMLSRALHYVKKFGVYLVSGKFLQNGRICMFILTPEGEPLLGQEAVFLNLAHRGDIFRGDSAEVADTPFGRVALAVDVDINHPPYVKALAAKGAQIIFSSRYLEIFDAAQNRIKAPVISTALSSGTYVVGVTNAGSCVAGPDGRMMLPVRDSLAITATVDLSGHVTDARRMATGRRLIDVHYGQTEVASHV